MTTARNFDSRATIFAISAAALRYVINYIEERVVGIMFWAAPAASSCL
jgi:hypothetical protein